MIYDYVIDTLSGFLIDEEYFQDDQILIEGQIPSEQLNSFCRLNWTFGSTEPFSTKSFNQTVILTLDLFERAQSSSTSIYDYAIDIRKELLNKYVLFKDEHQVAKLQNISISKSDGDEWNRFSLNITFSILN